MDRSLLHTRLRSFEDNDEIEQFVQYDLIMTNQEKVKEKLLELKETMEVIFPSLKGAINKELPTFEDSQELEVYHNLLLAIAEQNNMDIV